jgi:hypothetical protein
MDSEDNKRFVLTIRLIRSFNPPNIRNLVLKNVAANLKVTELKELIRNGNFLDMSIYKFPLISIFVDKELKTSNLPPPFKTFPYDSLKIEHIPFKAKVKELFEHEKYFKICL